MMTISITLKIPEESVYAGVVADALEQIAPYWDEGARGGELICGNGNEGGLVSWDSTAEDNGTTAEHETHTDRDPMCDICTAEAG